MNKENNQRFRETEEKIIREFTALLDKKPPERITVAELCRNCGINRSSFYLHFTDVYDMMDTIEEELARYGGRIFDVSAGEYRLGERFVRLLEFVREHRSFYRNYYREGREERLFHMVLPETLEASLQRLAGVWGPGGADEITYHLEFFRHGFASMVRIWLERDCPESPERMVEILSNQYRNPLLRSFFDSTEEGRK